MTRLGDAWVSAPSTRAICAMLTGAGHKALFVGGCVRNALLGRSVTDIDLATDARPEVVMMLAPRAGLRALPTGIAHGTVTVLSGGQSFEVTTFRRDVATDGRRAVVAFTDEIAEDARRRDFTMNALYARPDGTVLDPLGGLADLWARRVRFVGDPAARIAEDLLRILRFFRFYAWYGDPASGLDPEGLAACAAAQEGLARLSRERVGTEMRKLLAAPDPGPAAGAMEAVGVLARVLPGAETSALEPLLWLEAQAGLVPRWQRRLAALGRDAGWPQTWGDALRLSRAEARELRGIAEALASGEGPAAAAWRHGAEVARDAALTRAARDGAPLLAHLEAELARGSAARFPLRAADLAHEGPALGAELRRLEAAWTASDLMLDAAALRALDTDAGG